MASQCFNVKLIVSPPHELVSKLPQALRHLKEKLISLKGCYCSGGSYLYVCACHETLLKILLIRTQETSIIKGGNIGGPPAVEVILSSSNPQELIQVLDTILGIIKEDNLHYTFID